jgi:hypothetical protein
MPAAIRDGMVTIMMVLLSCVKKMYLLLPCWKKMNWLVSVFGSPMGATAACT